MRRRLCALVTRRRKHQLSLFSIYHPRFFSSAKHLAFQDPMQEGHWTGSCRHKLLVQPHTLITQCLTGWSTVPIIASGSLQQCCCRHGPTGRSKCKFSVVFRLSTWKAHFWPVCILYSHKLTTLFPLSTLRVSYILHKCLSV